jgi:hypothetical protein
MSNEGYQKLEDEKHHESIEILEPIPVSYPSISDTDQVHSPSPIVDFPVSNANLRDSSTIAMRHMVRNGMNCIISFIQSPIDAAKKRNVECQCGRREEGSKAQDNTAHVCAMDSWRSAKR